jgi:hypothetical protein
MLGQREWGKSQLRAVIVRSEHAQVICKSVIKR